MRHPLSSAAGKHLAVHLYGADRGFFSEKNVQSCERSGVNVVCIPQRGGKKTPESEHDPNGDPQRRPATQTMRGSRLAAPAQPSLLAQAGPPTLGLDARHLSFR